MLKFAWLIPLFPLAGFLITGLSFRNLSVKLSGWIASAMVLISFLLSVIVFFELAGGAPGGILNFGEWISAGNLNIPIELLIDRLSSLMMLIITGVGLLIHIYSIGYMHGDEGYNRFFAYMNLFIFFMLVLVLGGNFLIMFIGWEGVGLCSYLLIGFWNRNNEYNNAARKAFIMNRIGDLGFLLGMFLIYTIFGSLSYKVVFPVATGIQIGTPVLTVITLLLFAGATGKSAQIPLFTWLPDAMAGPTPVSALIHAATMVTAGIYMVARSSILFALSPVTMSVVAGIGLATALVAGIIALYQNDIKKVLAYSTVSQLGLMFIGLGSGAFSGAVFHLMTHAFFKALLFLAAGSVIHALEGEQDLRKMGGLRKKLPWTFIVFLTGTLAISGLPPFSGFFSKDQILAGVFLKSPVMWGFAVAVSVITASYIFRLFWLTFSGTFRGEASKIDHAHESPKIMMIPLVILGVLSAFSALPLITGLTGSNRFDSFLEPVFRNSDIIVKGTPQRSASSEYILMAVALALILAAIFLTYVSFIRKRHIPAPDNIRRKGFINLAYNKFYVDEIYDALIVRPLYKAAGFLNRIIDTKIIDTCVESVGKLVMFAGGRIRLLQTGNVGFYLFTMVIFIIIVLLFNLIR
jgi:NADH-quinone oxidoreductase subunit L